MLRAGRDTDAAGFITLIRDCWAEYPGCVFDLDGEVPELRALASHFGAQDGALWVAEDAGAVVGMVAVHPLHGTPDWEICRMYVAASQRGTGVAAALLTTAETHARDAGAEVIRLWSDTRFTRAHAFYAKQGYVRQGPIRVLNDLSNSLEFPFIKPARGVAVHLLDGSAAEHAERPLADILIACVAAGASVSFLPPLSADVAQGFWRRSLADIALGRKAIWVAWVDSVLAGTVTLDLAMPPNQPHRAEVAKLLVHPAARRRGVGQALMAALEAEAVQRGRRLLTLDTRADDAGEALYRRLGWQEAGRIPGFALNADGSAAATVFFYKQIGDA
ncbi:MAG: GNAT family N-acetyltransferase [Roseomonas sp.]|nr:GNAT family N-acetyltransferase [Roseomonas sp.]MCA3391074.1 GNAT family N-acetyltransferase [Roseomonas sp.]MCA3408522.1 GNAT family N-acetyltransferase [Roseomonas sp.]